MTVNAHHSDADLAIVLELARESWKMATTISATAKPRRSDNDTAIKDWNGPHRQHFGRLYEIEVSTSQSASKMMAALATAGAQYWMDAMNARTNRIHGEALQEFRQTISLGLPDPPDRPMLGTLVFAPPVPPHFQPNL